MSNEPLAALVQRVGAFTEAVADLVDEVTGLSGEVAGLRKRAGRHAGWITLDITLSVATILLGFILGGEVNANQELDARQQATQDRLEVQVQESCTFYALVLGSYRPESRQPGADRDTYDHSFNLMRRSFKNLECQNPIVPPATPTPAPPR